MNVRKLKLLRGSRGQSLLETALMMPLMLLVVLNAINLGYFFFVTVNLTASTRTGAEYAIVGPGSPGTTTYASANKGTIPVSSLLYQGLNGAVWNANSTTIQICSPSVTAPGVTGGTSGTPAIANCVKCTSSATCSSAGGTTGANATWIPDADPEAPFFVTSRVDLQYSFPPLIPGTPFNLILMNSLFNSGTGQYTFYRHIEMRAM
jgi:Flp pilus assembly protein TadG